MAKAKKDKTVSTPSQRVLDMTAPSERYEARVTRVTVCPVGARLFSERGTSIELADEAGGEYVKVTQHADAGDGKTIGIEPAEWPTVRDAIEALLDNVRVYNE